MQRGVLYRNGYSVVNRAIHFAGDSLKVLRDFPDDVRQDAGYQLHRLQQGLQPLDFKPMPTIGKGVEEIRLRDGGNTYRIIYYARFSESVFVLHAFQKKSQATRKGDLDLARNRFSELMKYRQ